MKYRWTSELEVARRGYYNKRFHHFNYNYIHVFTSTGYDSICYFFRETYT